MLFSAGTTSVTWLVDEDCLLTGVNNALHGGTATAKGLIFVTGSPETPLTFETPTSSRVLEQFYLLPTFQGILEIELKKGWVIEGRTGASVTGSIQLFIV